MLTVSEKYLGKVTFDPEKGLMKLGNRQLKLSDIRDAYVCGHTVLQIGRKKYPETADGWLLCLKLKVPFAQPGRGVAARKKEDLILWLESESDGRRMLDALRPYIGDRDFADDSQSFHVEKCIVEAKRGFSDYIRGGTAGSRPYGKAGLVAPIIIPEMHLDEGRVRIIYVGTNGYHQESQWFSSHPEDDFMLASADEIFYNLQLRETGCTASGLFQMRRIEKDENATGLWMVYLENYFDSICGGARWIEQLRASADGRLAEESRQPLQPRTKSMASEEKLQPSGQELLAALNLLRDAGVLTQAEWQEKHRIIDDMEV